MVEINNNLAFVFPGQGSQSVGMMAELANTSDHVVNAFNLASEKLGFDLWGLVQNGPEEELNKTQNTQPAILTASYAVWQTWCEQTDARPGWLAGHSLGEYTALVCSGALAFENAVQLVHQRGLFMQQSVPAGTGAMAAILGLTDEQVLQICSNAAQTEVVSAVNFNAPGQVVIAGQTDAVNRAMAMAKESGAKRALPLPVSVPSHCALMKPAADQLEEVLQNTAFSRPDVPVIHNVSARINEDPEKIPELLKEQLYQPVRWVESVQFLAEQGVTDFVECGPGKVLSGLNKRIVRQASHQAVSEQKSINQLLEKFT